MAKQRRIPFPLLFLGILIWVLGGRRRRRRIRSTFEFDYNPTP